MVDGGNFSRVGTLRDDGGMASPELFQATGVEAAQSFEDGEVAEKSCLLLELASGVLW